MCAYKQCCALFHVLWCLVYIGAGTIQMVAGVFFLVTLPIFKTGSNIWVGAWNILIGISCTIISCVGELTPKKQETLLYCTISILAVNVINLVLLEVGEWHYFMTDSVAVVIGQKNMKKLVYFAHMTTSLSTAIAIVVSFLDSQFTFCSMQHKPERKNVHEQVSDIEYIIPRSKTRSVMKQAHSPYNQYAQSWVFEAETPGSSKNESPYQKLPTLSQYDGSKTITIRTHTSARLELEDVELTPELSSKMLLVKPMLHVDPGSDSSNGRRSLNHMKSFPRTPSPNMSDSSSQDSTCNPPIYECLEKFIEPAIYRSRLNTAISLTAEQNVHRGSFSGRHQYSANDSPLHMEGPLVRPRSEIIHGNRLCAVECTSASDQVQYASLMAELHQSFKSNKVKFQTFSPDTVSGSDKTHSESKNSESDSQKTAQRGSDTEFSKELEAALQLIQDLESPNTIETPSEACRSDDAGVHNRLVCVKWKESELSDSTKTLSENVSPSDFPEENTIVPSNGKRLSLIMVNQTESSQSSSGYSSPSAGTSKRQSPIHSDTPSDSSGSSTLILESQTQIAFAIHNRGNSAIISLYSPSDKDGRKKIMNYDLDSQSNSLKKHNKINTMDRDKTSINGFKVIPNSQPSRWSMMARLGKKPQIQPKLAPELEEAIYKPESLAHLTDLELIARHERNKSIQREIEQRCHHRILGNPSSESHC